jgi:hypothetical protein
MKITFSLFLAAAAVALDSYAVETHFWQQTDASDFEKGSSKNLSLRSDGRLYLAPELREIYDPSTPYLWALAADAKGNLYAGGGGSGSGTAKLFRIDPRGGGKMLAELEGLEIHAIAVDANGLVYAATDPDGKIYQVSPDGKARVFYDPHAKYVWALAFNSHGDLFVATGDHGEIHRVTPDGKGSVFFKTEETHARSMAIDSHDNVIVGTEPGGLVMRVDSSGHGFVLYQTPKREVTAVAVDKSGEIYAAAVGSKAGGAAPPSVPLPPPPPPPAAPAAGPGSGARPSTAPATFALNLPSPISGGSEVYRFDTEGAPHRLWGNAQDIVYAITFDRDGRPLLATGNRGKLYRLDSPAMSTELVDAPPTQITGFVRDPSGRLFAVTGNIGRVYEIGPGLVKSGMFESEAMDAGSFSYWGRVSFRGTPANVAILTRSGNLNRPEDNWSTWAPVRKEEDEGAAPCARCLNGRVTSPSARFLQYKIELSSGAGSVTPEIASVEVAYLPKNVAPVVDEVEITPPNYKFPAPSTPIGPSQTLSLPALGQKKHASSGTSLELSSSQTLTAAKGFLGVRWAASDENGDALSYTVEIRGVGETQWKLLRNKLRDKYYSWDSTAFPDGEYEIRVTASDGPSNPPAQALSANLVSDPFLIDNSPPRIVGLSWQPAGGRFNVQWKARDERTLIDHAEYSVNGGEWIPIEPKTKVSDAQDEEYSVAIDRPGPGEVTIAVRVTDSYDNQAVDKAVVK